MVVRIVQRAIQQGKLTPLIRKQLAALKRSRELNDIETAALDRLQVLINSGQIAIERSQFSCVVSCHATAGGRIASEGPFPSEIDCTTFAIRGIVF